MKAGIKLDKNQLKAVNHGKGPLLIIAGAGTGKTTVITQRIKYLILWVITVVFPVPAPAMISRGPLPCFIALS